ncbi:ABC transporter permease subunit [Rhodopirellula sp. MGV]|uniref:ABC transporter permease subunit n=1 Tax=Rhodopirellula sp. MGV TaxID=2023130 RepID=UPI000B965996|nr:ABC transporter permease subunit [Rhodopirellula sp. MGV]OYP33094.1 hypothetical protein CGZ80_18575 [Rhodopirellula sp. MGV]PNY37952.1 hypothetical protein C2E31_05485 [Rhodopirellula baltica]
MRGVKRLATTLLILISFGTLSVTFAFYIVSRTDELAEERLQMSDVKPPPPEAFSERYARWIKTVVSSRFSDFGQSRTGPVKNIVASRLPITATIGMSSWLLGWTCGLGLAVGLTTRWRPWAQFHQQRLYPIAHAVPSLVVVILFYLVMIQFDPHPSRQLRTGVGIASLVVLMVPSTTALWLNGIQRVLQQEYVRVARARGISSVTVWRRHVLPNVLVSSGVLTQAVFSLAGLVVGSAFVEGVFRLGGVAEAFIAAATHGQAEMAAFATLLYFLVLAAGVLIAEGITVYLDPDGAQSHANW